MRLIDRKSMFLLWRHHVTQSCACPMTQFLDTERENNSRTMCQPLRAIIMPYNITPTLYLLNVYIRNALGMIVAQINREHRMSHYVYSHCTCNETHDQCEHVCTCHVWSVHEHVRTCHVWSVHEQVRKCHVWSVSILTYVTWTDTTCTISSARHSKHTQTRK